MPLSAGDKLGPYEILAPIGAGGMGEVYKARDTRLERTVAIKVSSSEFSERFQREAQAIASLNHPNICTLHDVGPDYLVMEFIEGSPLKGPVALREALQLGIQIAEALSHAHRHGVIHRDLKPGNILVTRSGAKVLDFGLAKFSRAGAGGSQPGVSLAATLTQPLTQQGTLLGTPQYMSPEQLEGQEADARSDIFAFGAVLYETITGRAPFGGKTQANVIASILAAEPPPVTSFQPLIPPALEHLIKTCLAKDPADRRQSMHDVLLELKWIAESGSQVGVARPVAVRRKRRERLSWVLAAVASAAALVLGFLHLREKPAESYAVRFEQPLPPKFRQRWYDMPAVSPDGRQIVFPGAALAGRGMLWLRRLDSSQPTPLAGTESSGTQITTDTATPFWSPDSRFIGYLADGKLRKIDTSGGPSQVLCDLLPGSYGASWSRQGLIVIGRWSGPIYQVPAAGGEPKPLLKLDESRKERAQFAPQFLPDGRHFLYTSASTEPGRSGIYVSSLDGKESRLLLNTDSNAIFVLPGYLLFARGQALMAQPFSLQSLQIEGEPFPVAESVGRSPVFPLSAFSSSLNGTLVYRAESSANLQLAWADRSGRRTGSIGEPRAYKQGNLSPDEKHMALEITDTRLGTDDIWILDLNTGILSRLTSDPHTEDTPVWSPDGREVWFDSNRKGPAALYRKLVGGGDEELMLPSTEANYPAQCLKDGSVLFMNLSGKSFFRLPPGTGARPETLLKTEYSKDEPRVSPDGRWVSYNTNESGRWEVYIASFPGFTDRRQVSNNGGVQGYWRKDGKELFYLALDGTMMSVEIKPGPPLEAGIPQALFQTRIPVGPTADQFAVTGDGKRFLLLESTESDEKPLSIVLNWPALARK